MMTSPALPHISVIVPHYDHEDVIARCLDALKQQDYQGPKTIYIVDNSPEYLLQSYEERYPEFIFLHEPKAGSYNARNKAIEHIKDGLVAFTDADCNPHKDWLSKGVDALITHDDAQLVGGNILVTPKHAEKPTMIDWLEVITAFGQKNFIKYAQYAATANLFTYYNVFEALGKFNGSLKSGADYKWTNHAHRQGYHIAYCPHAIVEHTARDHKEIMKRLQRIASGKRDYTKHHSPFMLLVSFINTLIPHMHKMKEILVYSAHQVPLYKKGILIVYYLYYRWAFSYFFAKAMLCKTDSMR